MKINIYDVYLTNIRTVIDESCNPHGVNYRHRFTRQAIVVKYTKHTNYFDKVYFIDLLSGKKIKSSWRYCEIGDEFVDYDTKFEPIINYIDFNIEKPNISKKKTLELIKKIKI